MPASGMLIQFDGSVETWFNNIVCDLIGGIDDATGEIVGLEFFHGETSLHCMKVMMDITLNYGVPDAYYHDGAGYFGKVDRDTENQIGRALEHLGSKALIARFIASERTYREALGHSTGQVNRRASILSNQNDGRGE